MSNNFVSTKLRINSHFTYIRVKKIYWFAPLQSIYPGQKGGQKIKNDTQTDTKN